MPDYILDRLRRLSTTAKDGAKWITECVNDFTPDCERCVDPFHVVQWAMEALDEVRREVWCEAYAEFTCLSKEHPRKKGRPKDGDPEVAILNAAKAKADEIKNSAYALGKAPENLTEKQQNRIAMIAENNNRLYRAYRMKEMLRLILKIKDTDEAETALNSGSGGRVTAGLMLSRSYTSRTNVTGITYLMQYGWE